MALSRQYRLSARDIRTSGMFKAGRVQTRIGIVYVKEKDFSGPRLAFVVSNKVSRKAHERNKLRRRASEWVRKRLSDMPQTSLLVVFKKEAVYLSRKKLYDALEDLFAKAGMKKDQ